MGEQRTQRRVVEAFDRQPSGFGLRLVVEAANDPFFFTFDRFVFGGPLGAQIGFMAGSCIGGCFDPSSK